MLQVSRYGCCQYCGTKFALEGWHGCLNLELAPFNIRTSILELGYFRTKIMSPGKVKYGSNRIPGHGDPRDKFADYGRI